MAAAVPPENDHERRRSPTRGARDRVILLLVDDSPDTRDTYATHFQRRNFKVLTAHDGFSAITMARRYRPDLIVMDLSMPNIDGITATRQLKTDARTRSVPVVILTGYPLRAIDQGVLEAGADAFLTKPCLPEDLEQHLRWLLARRRR